MLVEEEVEETKIFYYRPRFINSAELTTVLENFITPTGMVASSEDTETVVVQDVEQNIARIKDICEKLDHRVPQILVQAQIVEMRLDNDYEKEFRLAFEHVSPKEGTFLDSFLFDLPAIGNTVQESPGGSLNLRPYVRQYNGGTKRNTLTMFFRYLESRGQAKILSAPNLILRRGAEGSILTGEEVPIQEQTVVSGSISTSTKFKSVGVKLRVVPKMIVNNTVYLSINPEVSNITRQEPAGANGLTNPVIAVRKASTELEIKDGELLVLGGLLTTEERVQRNKVPILGSCPGIGHLFRSTRIQKIKTHLMIFLHIEILQESEPNSINIRPEEPVPPVIYRQMDKMEKNLKQPFVDIGHDLSLLKHEEYRD